MGNKLTQVQEALAQAYILCHGDQTKAYLSVHSTKKITAKTSWEMASRAFSDDKVLSRIQELNDLATERHLVTIESITKELEESFIIAKGTEQASAMTGSTVAKAKLHGFMVDKQEVKIKANILYNPIIKRFDGSMDEEDGNV